MCPGLLQPIVMVVIILNVFLAVSKVHMVTTETLSVAFGTQAITQDPQRKYWEMRGRELKESS